MLKLVSAPIIFSQLGWITALDPTLSQGGVTGGLRGSYIGFTVGAGWIHAGFWISTTRRRPRTGLHPLPITFQHGSLDPDRAVLTVPGLCHSTKR
ncbi:hypothetical protein V8F33_002526 [Rhypophila sp. PSN 637]